MNLTAKQSLLFKTKCYQLTVVTYLSEDIVIDRLNQCSDCVDKWAYAEHLFDGKKPHIHIILKFRIAQTLLKYVKLFESTEIESLDKYGLSYMWSYLIHDTDLAKEQCKFLYDVSVRKSNDYTYFENLKKTKKSGRASYSMRDMLADILVLSSLKFVDKYGMCCLLNYEKLYDFAVRCKNNGEFEED